MHRSSKVFRKQALIALALYATVLVASLEAIIHLNLGWGRILAAILPILPCLLFVRAFTAMMGSCDELQVRIQFQALAFAFAGTAVLTLTYGFLQNVGAPNVNWVWVWPLMGTLWVIGKLVAQRKYR